MSVINNETIFNSIKNGVLSIDPVHFVQKYLTLDGDPFRVSGNGYKPFADIYRYIGVKSLEKDAKPLVFIKGRQVGGTTMASALELYFMTCGLFGTNGKPPIRIMHCFPLLELGFMYTKTKLNTMIKTAVKIDAGGNKRKSFIESKIDMSASSKDSLKFKQFKDGNLLFIESTGIDANRIHGFTADGMFFDECFPYDQYIKTNKGNLKIGHIYDLWKNNEELPLVLSYNESKNTFEYKKITKAWKRDEKEIISFLINNQYIQCTPNHRFLSGTGWIYASDITPETPLKTTPYIGIDSYAIPSPISYLSKKEITYDIEVEDNHNFIVTSFNDKSVNTGIIAHNCQDIPGIALANATKILSQSKYGKPGDGIQVYFGTPRQKGSEFHRMWTMSSQQFYHLGCEKCGECFPLYTPGSNDWEDIWIEDDYPPDYVDPKTGLEPHGFIVKCVHCGHEQDKRPASERGKWISTSTNEKDKFVGYHLNQLYMPNLNRQKIIDEKPENHPVNTERAYFNEVLGEFYAGEASPITAEQIHELCADVDRKFRREIPIDENKRSYLGCDWGQKVDATQIIGEKAGRQQGQSYSSAVVLTVEGPELLVIDYAMLLKKNDPEYKKAVIDQIMRQYSISVAVGDIGYANDLMNLLQREYGDRFLSSRVHGGKMKHHVKYVEDIFPKEIQFEKNYYIEELFTKMKKGHIRFPYGNYEQIGWLVTHCSSMEIKGSMDRTGNVNINYVKGATPNDGFMALLNAYLAYKWETTDGFRIIHPDRMNTKVEKTKDVPVLVGYIPGINALKRKK